MFKDLIEAWRGKDMLNRMYEQLLQMLSDTHWMFEAAQKALFDEQLAPNLVADLYDRDVRVNKTERKIRKQLVEHLTIRPKVDVPICLVLMSVVKDAERIGDYCKNLYEIRELMRGPFTQEDGVVGKIRAIFDELLITFDKTAQAFRDSDEAMGHDIIEREVALGRQTEDLIKVVAASNVPTRDAVALTMCIRFLKRVSGHLGNIASSVVMPVHKIDYFDEKWEI